MLLFLLGVDDNRTDDGGDFAGRAQRTMPPRGVVNAATVGGRRHVENANRAVTSFVIVIIGCSRCMIGGCVTTLWQLRCKWGRGLRRVLLSSVGTLGTEQERHDNHQLSRRGESDDDDSKRTQRS